jgi:copper homeostasis protein CutC
MADRMQYDEDDPRHHTMKLIALLEGVVEHAREDAGKIDDPQAKALFETTAEVCSGLTRAFEHYENRSEPAWQI